MKDQLQPEQHPRQLLITVDEAAQRLSIGRSHIYQQMQLGRLRSVRIGRSRRILENDLKTFIEELLDRPTSGAYHVDRTPARSAVKSLPLRHGRR